MVDNEIKGGKDEHVITSQKDSKPKTVTCLAHRNIIYYLIHAITLIVFSHLKY